MPQSTEPLIDRIMAAQPSLAAIVADAERTWRDRRAASGESGPVWQPFEDAFPTFYQFTNRPR